MAPASSLSATPSRAAIQLGSSARYPVRKNHSVPENRHGWWSPQLSAPSPRNAVAILSMSMNIDPNAFIARATKTGEESSARASAASGDSSYRSLATS